MAGHSVIAFERWGSRRSSPRRDLRGRTRTLSVLSVRSAESVWITSSSSANGICAACYRAIFNTTMTPERIFRLARSVRGRVPYNLPRPAILLPSRKLAVCTIAMSVEPLRPHVPARTRPSSNCRHDNFQILSKDSNALCGDHSELAGNFGLWFLDPVWNFVCRAVRSEPVGGRDRHLGHPTDQA